MDTQFTFTGARKSLAKMHWKGFWLMLITLGIYRFWFKTNIRKYYWANIAIGDERLEYTGTGGELFKGFLIALCFIVPLQIAIGLGTVTTFSPLIFLAVTLIFLLLGNFAIYASRRYRLNRTLWRGLRFRMEGSAWKYAFRAMGWSVLSLLTLGLITPWATADLEKYKMKNTYFGDIQGDFHGKPFVLFKKIAWILILTSIPFIVALVYLVMQISAEEWSDIFIALRSQDEESINEVFENLNDNAKVFGLLFMTLLPVYTMLSFAFLPAYIAILFRWTASGISLGEARITSTFSSLQSYKIWGKSILFSMAITTALSILISIIIMIGVFALKDVALSMMKSGFGIAIISAVGIFLYLMIFFLSWLFKALLITFSYWRDQTNSLTISNIDALENAVARAHDANAIGEGFDAGGGFGDVVGL
jgi:hypothetical protein